MVTCSSVFGQKETGSHLVFSVNGGITNPLGNYGKGDYADEKSGFAKTGGHVNITGVYYLSKSFGIGALMGYSQFGHKNLQNLADGYKEDSGTDSTTLFSKGSNHSLSFLVGPYYSFAISKKLSLDIRLMGGYVKTNLAGFEVHYEDYTDNIMTQKESSGGAFGFQGGAGLTYMITKMIGIKANADYFSSKPKINISYDNFIVNSGRRLDTYNESISGVNATIGIAVNF